MAQNVFYRDFTLCKAAALVGLIVLAMALHSNPKHVHATDSVGTERILPAHFLNPPTRPLPGTDL
ncbi:MAG: hypothetical protein N4A61_10490 [Pelagimonas sp.]|jgi:hypothetical protein|nr:hypothetical protein [Pelagimonas sp.]